MSWLGTMRSLGEALGIVPNRVSSVGCNLGRVVYSETRRAAQIANITRPRRTLTPKTQAMLRSIFPDLDVGAIRVRTRCRLPANRFQPSGSIYAMTFGTTMYWRDDLDESNPVDLVHLIHETTHVDQVRRFGSEDEFACEYGIGYLRGGGELPSHIAEPSDYHRNPLEAEAYRKESPYRDDRGRVVPSRLPR